MSRCSPASWLLRGRSWVGAASASHAANVGGLKYAHLFQGIPMTLTPELRERIERTLNSNRVVLFMKGTPEQPRCGFSAKAVGILGGLVDSYGHVDVLADSEIREGIKEYGQ